jgi:membrane peptidoglycan carboxypeptidase
MQRGTGTRAAISRPSAGKTGTTNQRVSVWFVGYTPELATAVWAGNPSPPRGGYPLQNRLIGGRYYGDVCGGCLPGPIWRQMMTEALADVPVSSFSDAAEDVVSGDSISVPSVSGLSVEKARRKLQKVDLEPVVSSDRVYADYAPAGTVAYSFPGTGAAVYPGQRVVIYVSAGAAPTQPSPGPDDPDDADGPTLGPNPDDCVNSNRPECRDEP